MTRVKVLGALLTASMCAPAVALGHGGNPAVAWLDNPVSVGTVVDDSFTFTWVDFDMSIPTGTATIDFHYTNRRPPSYLNGDIHPLLEGTPIVQGIWEKDSPNTYTWDTSNVPAGSYMIWSIVIEPPEEMMSPQIISFSPGVLTVAHPGDEVHPAVHLTTPESPFTFADDEHEIRWDAFDPDGTGRVKLEAGTSSLGADFTVLAEDLAPDAGAFTWVTTDLEETEWYVRATITDDRNLSFTTYSEYVLQVSHLPDLPDATVRDARAPPDPMDAGVADAGGKGPAPEGCTCLDVPVEGAGLAWAFGLAGLLALRRRR